jgi:hypothetical protein
MFCRVFVSSHSSNALSLSLLVPVLVEMMQRRCVTCTAASSRIQAFTHVVQCACFEELVQQSRLNNGMACQLCVTWGPPQSTPDAGSNGKVHTLGVSLGVYRC